MKAAITQCSPVHLNKSQKRGSLSSTYGWLASPLCPSWPMVFLETEVKIDTSLDFKNLLNLLNTSIALNDDHLKNLFLQLVR